MAFREFLDWCNERAGVSMTDNGIIKALECLGGNSTLCQQCAYDQLEFPRCKENCAKYALYIITRQKAKIEALEMDNAQLQSDNINANMNCEHLQAEIERLKGWDRWIVSESHAPIIKKARAEAIKEFAERLKEKAITYYTIIGRWVSVKDIDNLVKEMEGEHEVS